MPRPMTENQILSALRFANATEAYVEVRYAGSDTFSGTAEVLGDYAVEIRERCHPEDSAEWRTIAYSDIDQVLVDEIPETDDDLEVFYRDEPCTCCGQPKPAQWDDVVDAINEAIEESVNHHGVSYRAALVDTGGSCYAIEVSGTGGQDRGADLHRRVMLTSGGPLLPDRQHELSENNEATWEIGIDNPDGTTLLSFDTRIAILPEADASIAGFVVDLLYASYILSPRGWSN
jgi:hypothetical protein